MTFWDVHAKAEAAHKEAEEARRPPSSQNAPMKCARCGVVDTDVLLGYCAPCAAPDDYTGGM